MPLITNMRSRFLGGGRKWYRAGGAPLPIAVYQAKGAASLAVSYVNLANPGTYNAAPGTAPTFDASTGWIFSLSQYLKTGILSGNNMTVIVRFSDATNSYSAPFGSRDATTAGLYSFARDGTEANHTYQSGGTRRTFSPVLANGIIAIAGTSGFLNGTRETNTLNNSIANPLEIYLGAYNNNGSANGGLGGKIQAVVIYNSVLTDEQVAAVSAAMAAL